MRTSITQDRAFIDTIIPERLLEAAIDWIVGNISPEDVYGRDVLLEWAAEEGMMFPDRE